MRRLLIPLRTQPSCGAASHLQSGRQRPRRAESQLPVHGACDQVAMNTLSAVFDITSPAILICLLIFLLFTSPACIKATSTGCVQQQCQVEPERGSRRRWRPPQQASSSAPQVFSIPLDEERVESQRLSGPLPRPGQWSTRCFSLFCVERPLVASLSRVKTVLCAASTGPGSVRCSRHRKTNDGDRVQRNRPAKRGRRQEGEDLQISGI